MQRSVCSNFEALKSAQDGSGTQDLARRTRFCAGSNSDLPTEPEAIASAPATGADTVGEDPLGAGVPKRAAMKASAA